MYLKKIHGNISGDSSPMAIGFWTKMGAKFDYEVEENMINYLLDMGEFPPFKIIN